MKFIRLNLWPLILYTLAAPLTALASADVERGLIEVGGGLLNESIGTADGYGTEIGTVVLWAMQSFIPLMNAAAVLIIVIYGLWMILTMDENQATNARNTIITVCIAIVLLNVSEKIYIALISWDREGGDILAEQAMGLFRFLETPLATIAVLMIVITGIRALVNFGSDDGLTNIRSTIIAIGFGIILLGFKYFVVQDITEFFRPAGIVTAIMNVVNGITVFIGLLAVIGIVYAGFLMILGIGNEEQYGKAKGLLARIIIGIIIILVSVALINLILDINMFAGWI